MGVAVVVSRGKLLGEHIRDVVAADQDVASVFGVYGWRGTPRTCRPVGLVGSNGAGDGGTCGWWRQAECAVICLRRAAGNCTKLDIRAKRQVGIAHG
jgi:hypothetical protein